MHTPLVHWIGRGSAAANVGALPFEWPVSHSPLAGPKGARVAAYCVTGPNRGDKERDETKLFERYSSLIHMHSRIRCLHPAVCGPLCPHYLLNHWLPVPGYTPSGRERFQSVDSPQGEHPIIHLRWRVSSRPRDSLSPASRDGPSCCGPILQIGGWTTGGVYKPTVDPPATYRRCVICHMP